MAFVPEKFPTPEFVPPRVVPGLDPAPGKAVTDPSALMMKPLVMVPTASELVFRAVVVAVDPGIIAVPLPCWPMAVVPC